MTTLISDLLLATTVRAQMAVADWVDSSAQSTAFVAGQSRSDITIQCDWVNEAQDVEDKAGYFIGNLWGLLAVYGGYVLIALVVIIAVLGKFAFAKRLTGTAIWIFVGLLAVGVVIQIVQNNIVSAC